MQQQTQDLASEMARTCLGSRVGRLHRIVARRFEVALAPTGLTPPQLEILAALTVAGTPVPPSVLAGVLAVERSTMSRNLALMRERGWIEPADRSAAGRAMTVVITDDGRAAFAGAREAWTEAQREVQAALGDGAADGLDGWLERLGWGPAPSPA